MRITCLLLVATVAVSCSSESASPSVDPFAPQEVRYDIETANRKAPTCKFQAGDIVGTTVGPETPSIPLKHVVVLMMENRSFDHLFAQLDNPEADVKTNGSNPDPFQRDGSGAKLISQNPKLATSALCEASPNHEWGPSHLQYNNGQMDGFVAASEPNGPRVMEYYTKDDIPFYHYLASKFAISDRNFGSLLGPTWPNRLFLIAATSCGWAEAVDTNEGIEFCAVTTPNIFNQLDDASVSFKIFLSVLDYGIPIDSMVSDIGAYDNPLAFATIDDFQSQASTNSLPEFSLIEPNYESYTVRFGGAPNDDHPPANIQRGQWLVYNVVAALMSNEETWKSSALFITYDENGGYYDHYAPPPACEPVRNAPVADYAFDRYGFRVPLIVVSPYVTRPGYVSHRVTDHTSILRFIQAWKNLGALTSRDANAWPLLDIFNFDQTPAPAPDISQHKPNDIDAVREASCPEK